MNLFEPDEYLALPPRLDDPAFGHWFAGFVAGEGCFTLKQHDRNFYPRFEIDLRRDDHEILQQIAAFVGHGAARELAYRPRSTTNTMPASRYLIQNTAKAHRLCSIFNRFPLRAKKAEDFAIWQDALSLPPDRRHEHYEALRRAKRYDGPIHVSERLVLRVPPSLFDEDVA